jgi:2-deoxy-D-gluconate 3-dehydrogenase
MSQPHVDQRADPLFDLTGRLAVVTGARRGIGRAAAIALAGHGTDIIGVSKSLANDSDVEREVRDLGRSFWGYACDFGDRTQTRRLLESLGREHPVPDILVNNAGEILREDAVAYPDDWWDQLLEVNLSGPFLLAREIGRQMVAKGSGKIIFTCSLLSFEGGIRVPGYTASKHGVAGLVKALANEWARFGVNVNGIAPGYIATDNTTALRADADRAAQILARIPAGRWGSAEDFAGPMVFLASDASAYVHGEILVVDGGWMGR